MNEELKPCPFCGSEAGVWNNDGEPYVLCTDCGVWMRETISTDAIAAWNTRANPWRPIETAPKGEALSYLVFRPKTAKHDTYDCVIQVSNYEGRMYPDARQCCIDWEDGIEDATHWMPLPEPPEVSKGDESR